MQSQENCVAVSFMVFPTLTISDFEYLINDTGHTISMVYSLFRDNIPGRVQLVVTVFINRGFLYKFHESLV